MRITDLNGKKVCILGFGKEGQATLAALAKYAPSASITIADQSSELRVSARPASRSDGQSPESQLGERYLEHLDRFDVIIKTPGIPPKSELKAVINKVTTATNIFFDSIEGTGATVIGVTGSKGKSTTTSLIHHCLKAAKKDVHLVGNIGEPALAHLDAAKENAVFVMEMSSYQLMDATKSPHIAVITAFFPEHLDYHASTALSTGSSPLEAYFDAKSHIVRFQKKDDLVVFNAASPEVTRMAKMSAGKKIPFASSNAPLELSETKLLGEHNQSNIAAAWKACELLGVDREIFAAACKTFNPLPHRLQSLGVHDGYEWIDDAISTTPDSTIAALRALGKRVKVLLLGGQDRGVDFAELAEEIIEKSAVEAVILFPGSGERIRKSIEEYMLALRSPKREEENKKVDRKLEIVDIATMQEAVVAAKKTLHSSLFTLHSPIVLLSPASPSYGMFKNFEEKGETFAREIAKK